MMNIKKLYYVHEYVLCLVMTKCIKNNGQYICGICL